jgi:hypothetical protein
MDHGLAAGTGKSALLGVTFSFMEINRMPAKGVLYFMFGGLLVLAGKDPRKGG